MQKQLFFTITITLISIVIFFMVYRTSEDTRVKSNLVTQEQASKEVQAKGNNSTVIVLDNAGDPQKEGHTPTTFEGSGTGLFIGDNLHNQFPVGAGLQSFIFFDLSSISKEDTFKDITLSSSFTRVEGNPQDSLGKVLVDVISYDTFSPRLWNLPPQTTACVFEQQSNQSYKCAVTEALEMMRTQDMSKIAFRVRFEKDTDNDGQKDLLSFRHYDPNANFPGLFQLTFTPSTQQELEELTIPITAHRIIDSDALSTNRTQENIKETMAHAQNLWSQANISFDLEIRDTTLTQQQITEIKNGNFTALTQLKSDNPNTIQGFFVQSLGGINGVALSDRHFAVVDETTVYTYRTVAHEIGHNFGLPHVDTSIGRLLYQGSDGHVLSPDEITKAREGAKSLLQNFEKSITSSE